MHPTAARRLGLLVLVALVVAAAWSFLPWPGDPAAPDRAMPTAHPSSDATAPGIAAAAAANPTTTAPGPEREAVATDRIAGAPPTRANARLVDAAGQPVAGQPVQLLVGADTSRNDARVRLLGSDRTSWSPGELATSGDDGAFVLNVPRGVAARVVPVGGDWVFRQGPVELAPQLADTVLGDIVVQRACVIAGVVRDLRGAPCRGVAVLCGADGRSFDEGRAARVETGDDGTFRFASLANGSYRLLCRSPQFVPQSRTLDLLPEQQLLDVAFALAAGGSIAGRVVDDTGAPVADAEVRAQPVPATGSPARVRSAADGTFVLGGLVDGAFDLTVRAKGHRGDKAIQADVGARDVTLRLVRAAAIAGVVVDRAGTPVPGSRVRAVPASQTVEQDRARILFNPGVVTGADGRFAVNDLAGGDYRVIASGPHLEATVSPVHAEAGKPVDLTIPVQRGGLVRVAVQAPDGACVAGARVRVAEQSVPDQDRPMVLIGASDFDPDLLTLGQRVSRTTTDAQGVALVPGLEAGSYRVGVAADAGVQEQPALVTVPAGEEVAVTVKLTPGGFVQVEVADARGTALPKKRVEIEGPLDAAKVVHRGGDTGVDGTMRLGPLAPGRYDAAIGKPVDTDAFGGGVLVMSGGGPSLASTRVWFTARAGETVSVRLVLPDLATLRGTLRDRLGPIANGNVQLGAAEPDRSAGARFGLDGSTRSVRTRPDGTFTIPDLEPGSYRVRYGKAKQELLAECAVTVGTSDVPLDLLVQCGTLRITARSASEQKPLAGARATLRRAADNQPTADPAILDYAFPQSPTAEATADAAGVVSFGDVPFGSYVIEVQAPAHRTTRSPVVGLDAATADAGVVELQASGRIAGTFVDATGAAPTQAYAEYRKVDAKDFQPGFAGRGKFEIDGLEPGNYVLRARRLGGAPGAGMLPPGPEATVHVRAGAVTAVDLRLPDA